jgi:L-threonylcarbamoyladenylate synthase
MVAAHDSRPEVADLPLAICQWGIASGALPWRSGALPNGELPDGELPDGELPDGELPDGELPVGLCHGRGDGYCRRMTETLPATPDGIKRAAQLLRAGALVAFGTETVYGLGGDATNAAAAAEIFAAKGRPRFNPLISHYPAAEAVFEDVTPNDIAVSLASAFWPGPLTMVLRRRTQCRVALLTGAGLDTLAVRVPRHRDALALLRAVNRPVAAPSANRSGQVSPTTAAHVLDGMRGRIAAVLDSGPCEVGVESTVLDLSDARPILLRPGGVTVEALEAVIGPIAQGVPPMATRALRSPGQLMSHYAPSLPVRMNVTSVTDEDTLLAFGEPCKGAGVTFQLSESGDVIEAAARLFDGLRWLDTEGQRRGLRGIAAMPVPDAGLGRAINDRLRRAAAPRG